MGNTTPRSSVSTPRSSITTPRGEDVIIKKPVAEVSKLFRQPDSHILIWYDPNNHFKENKKYLDEMEALSSVQPFSDWDAAINAISENKTHCHVITAGTNGETLSAIVSAMPNVLSISVFCRKVSLHSKWAKRYKKVICVENNFKILVEKLSNCILKWQRQEGVNLRIDFPCFAPIFDDTDKSDVNKLHHYLTGLTGFQNIEQSKNDFLELASVIYREKSNMESFRKTYNGYNMRSILNWYTKESFLYKITNNCLRIRTPDTILYCRMVLRDLVTAIKEQYQKKSKEFNGLLYRGTYISSQEWTQLEENIGKPIEMLGFLSTTKHHDVALSFAQQDINNKALITIIVPPAPDLGESGFAEVKEFSDFKKEEEVLFNVMSRFTILKAGFEEINGVKCRHLVLLYGAQAMRKLLASQKSEINIVITKKELMKCTRCKSDILQSCKKYFYVNILDKEKVCEKCIQNFASTNSSALLYVPFTGLKSVAEKIVDVKLEGIAMKYNEPLNVPFYGYKCKMCRTNNLDKNTWYYKCLTCKTSIKKWCKDCFNKSPNCLTKKHQIILETRPYVFWTNKMSKDELDQLKYVSSQLETDHGLYQQAETFYNTHDYKKAKDCYEQLLSQDAPQKDYVKLYHNLARSYSELGDYKNALLFSNECLNARKKIPGEKSIQLAEAYDTAGSAYQNLADYNNALDHYKQALEIRKEVFGEVADKHPKVADSYTFIGSVYRDLADYSNALEHFNKGLEIRKAIYEGNHPSLAESHSHIGLVHSQRGEYKKALEHHTKALEMRKAIYGETHPKTANSYNNIGIVYHNMKDFKKAVEYYTKSLEIRKEIYQEDHVSIAESYNSMGLVYNNLKEYHQALQHHESSLKIKKKVYGENHPKTANSYNNIGLVYHNMKEYRKAVEYYTKSLEIRKGIYRENHPLIADSYNNIGLAQSFLGEQREGMQLLMKSLDLKTVMYGDKHPKVVSMRGSIKSWRDFEDGRKSVR